MQDKEVLDEAEEALTFVTETNRDKKDSLEEKKDSSEGQGKKEVAKDGKFAFRKIKQPKKEKADKKSPSRFESEGVSFKAKLIGVEKVSDARGDKMCQEAMQRLKLNVRNTGPHKRKIIIYVSLQGIKIKDEKSGDIIYHHPVPLISFISQDITDARAFGYVFGSSDGQHQFIAIKTEKPAFHVVLALRDLFQTVLNWKQEKMEQVKENKGDEVETASSIGSDSIDEKVSIQDQVTESNFEESNNPTPKNILFDVILTEPLKMTEPEVATDLMIDVNEPIKTVDHMLGLQNELNKLQQGIEQIDTSIAAAAFNLGINPIENDPFDTSFVTPCGPIRDGFPQPMPTPVPLTTSAPIEINQQASNQQLYGDKYAVFSALNSGPSVFESSPPANTEMTEFTTGQTDSTTIVPELQELEEEIKKKSSAPVKPPRQNKSSTPDLTLFADLDPLGKDRPYKDKTEFFQDVKNPPKKVLNDLVDKTSSSGEESVSRVFDTNLGSPPFAFPMGLDTLPPPQYPAPQIHSLSSSLPNSFLSNLKLSVAYPQNGNINSPYNPFDNSEKSDPNSQLPPRLTTRGSEPAFHVLPSPPSKILSQNGAMNNGIYLGKTPPPSHNPVTSNTQFTIQNSSMHSEKNGFVQSQSTLSSSPIPIPSRQQPVMESKDRSFSNGSISNLPYSKSPVTFDAESPTHIGYLGQHFMDSESTSPVGLMMKNGIHINNKMQQNKKANSETLHGFTLGSPPLSTNGNSYSNKMASSPPKNSSQNGVSRPRPRPSLSKGTSLPNNGLTPPSQPYNIPASENEVISRENMQSIANVLLSNGHRIRTHSLPVESHIDFKFTLPGEKNIFKKTNDPFGDDFFCSLPKKANNLHTKTEIQEYV